MHLRHIIPLVSLLLLTAFGCSSSDEGSSNNSNEQPADMTPSQAQDMGEADMSVVSEMGPPKDMGSADQGIDFGPLQPKGSRVITPELDQYTTPLEAAAAAQARVFLAENPEDFLPGAVAHGQPDDYVMDNGLVRFVIETPARAMSPCPYGGNIIDGAINLGTPQEPKWADDMLQEVCLMVNIGQTLSPETYEIVQQGSTTEPAILAVTGAPKILDFLNFKSFVVAFLGENFTLPFDPDRSPPITITQYYVLHPGAKRVQVVTAFRNDSDGPADEIERFLTGHLITGGGTGGYFNPLGTNEGFGSESFSPDSLNGSPYSYITYLGEKGSYSYVTTPSEEIEDDLPAGGINITVSGATATLHNQKALVPVLFARDLRRVKGSIQLVPRQITHIWHSIALGDKSLNSTADQAWSDLGVETGTVQGTLLDQNNQPVADARVTAISVQNKFATNQTHTKADGSFSMLLPIENEYELRAYKPNMPQQNTTPVTLTLASAGDVATEDSLRLIQPGTLKVNVKTPDGSPTPARLTIVCATDPCPERPTPREFDITSDALPTNIQAIVPVGMSGTVDVTLTPGDYSIIVSRGMEWSLWPADAQQTKGFPLTIKGGEPQEVTAEIAQVITSTNVVSADFHIHAISSTDSAVGSTNRVLDFLTEGVDVMVSTDHDYISDFAPAIKELGAESQIISIIGSEITTSDSGHFNAFPLAIDPNDHRGGALDWGNGDDVSLLPKDIYAWANAFDGEQVIQVNHPEDTGTIGSLQVDTLLGTSSADPVTKRLPADGIIEDGKNTGLWSEEFTAMEMFNGHNTEKFWGIMRWWLTMVGRGFTPTATAVTDTHRLYSNLGAAPRSFVALPNEIRSVADIDQDTLAKAVNEGRLIGTNGPYFTITATNTAGDKAQPGDTLTTEGNNVQLEVLLQMPEWVKVDTIEVYLDRQDVVTPVGEFNEMPIPPDITQEIELDPNADLVVRAQGDQEHKAWRKSIQLEIDRPDKDSYIVVVIRQKNSPHSMWPVVTNPTAVPLAFSNPIYLDGDGNGWDNPPLKMLAQSQSASLNQGVRWKQSIKPQYNNIEPLNEAEFAKQIRLIYSKDDNYVHNLYPMQVIYQEEFVRRLGHMLEAAQCSR